MGASEFVTTGKGKTAQEAFKNARENAQYESGHSGYTGTIAEKDSFEMVKGIVEVPTVGEAHDLAEKLMNEDDKTYGDKWGPAHCIRVSKGSLYVFFGWASS